MYPLARLRCVLLKALVARASRLGFCLYFNESVDSIDTTRLRIRRILEISLVRT